MGGEQPKQFRQLGNYPTYRHSVRALSAAGVDGIVIVVPPARVKDILTEVESADTIPIDVCAGGAIRRDSVRAGVDRLPDDTEIVVVHDAARPFLPCSVVHSAIDAAREYGCAVAGLPVADTLKRGTESMKIVETVDRTGLYRAQTPQVFRKELLDRILSKENIHGSDMTDEAMGSEQLGIMPRLVRGSAFCLKITTSEDFAMAEALYSWLYTNRRHHADWSWL